MASDVQELVGFLLSPRPEVQRMAVGIVAGLTGSEEGMAKLIPEADVITAALVPLLSANQEISRPAAEALVNLAQHESVAAAMVCSRGRVVETAGGMAVAAFGSLRSKHVRLMVMLLANLTQRDEGCEKLIDPAVNSDRKMPLLAALMHKFASTSGGEEEGKEDEYEHVATILVNVTRLEAARKLLLDPDKKLLRLVLPQISSQSTIRSQGAMSCVRNCCFDAGSGGLATLLLSADLLWPALLLPVAGTKIYSAEDRAQMPSELAIPLSMERPPVTDAKLRVDGADALFLIASEEAGKRALWAVHGARILQVGYEDEEDPTVLEAMERIGSLLVDGSLETES